MNSTQETPDIYLLTGATGYVGGAVTRLLLDRAEGKEISGVPSVGNKKIKVRLLVRDVKKAKEFADRGAEIIQGDLTDPASLKRAVQGVRGVYHIAAIYREAGLPEEVYFNINAKGTKDLFEAAVQAGVKRIIHCSTGGVLGHIANPPGNENTPYNPGDVYQGSKVEGEKTALEYFRSGKITGAIIRPAMVYGPADTRHLKMFKMIAKNCFFYVGKGDAWVNFIDIRDLSRSFILAMDKEHLNGGIYTIANNSVMKLHEAVDIIAKKLGVSAPWLHLPVKPMQWLGSLCETVCAPFGIKPPIFKRRVDFFTKSRYFDPSSAHRDLGFAPAQSIEKEIEDTVNWYKEHHWI